MISSVKTSVSLYDKNPYHFFFSYTVSDLLSTDYPISRNYSANKVGAANDVRHFVGEPSSAY